MWSFEFTGLASYCTSSYDTAGGSTTPGIGGIRSWARV